MTLFALGPAVAFMLIALAVGYLALIKGDKEKGFLRALGLVLGFFVIVMSFFMVLLFANLMSFEKDISMMAMRRPMMMKQQMPTTPRTIMPMRPKMAK